MKSPIVNLLPERRVRKVRLLALARGWMLACACCAVAFWTGGFALSRRVAPQQRSGGELQEVRTTLASRQKDQAEVRVRVSQVTKKVEAARAVGHHPNWSVLLAFLAQERGEEVVFSRCDLTKFQPASSGTSYKVTVQAIASSVREANEFVQRLEQAGIFDDVRMGETNVRDGGRNAVALTRFTITGELNEPRGKEQP